MAAPHRPEGRPAAPPDASGASVARRSPAARRAGWFLLLIAWSLAIAPVRGHDEDEASAPGGVLLLVASALDAEATLARLRTPADGAVAAQVAVAALNTTIRPPGLRATAYRTLLAGRVAPADAPAPNALAAIVAAGRGVECLVADDTSPVLAEARSLAPQVRLLRPGPGEELREALRRRLGEGLGGHLLLVDVGAEPEPERLLVAVAGELDPELDLAMLVAPAPAPTRGPWDRLAAIVAVAPGWAGRLLLSDTTRTAGLAANVDPMATALAWLHVPPPRELTGRPLRPGPPHDLRDLLGFVRHAQANRRMMVPLLMAWGLGAAVVFAVWWRAMATGSPKWRAAARTGPAVAAAVPAAFLVVGAMPVETDAAVVASHAAAVAGIAAVAFALGAGGARGVLSPFRVAAGITGALLVGDQASGGAWLRRSLLADFPLMGVRFYGIGNDFGAIFVGLAVGLPLLMWLPRTTDARWGRVRWLVAGAWWLGGVIVLGAPPLGANLGMALAMAAAALTAAALLLGRKARGCLLLGGVGATALAFALVWGDSLRPAAAQSHLGRFAANARELGWSYVAEVVTGKLGLSLRFLADGYFWFGMGVVALLLGLWYHRAGHRSWRAVAPPLQVAVVAGGVGGLVALVVNDTGLVAGPLTAVTAFHWWLDGVIESRPAEAGG